MGEGNLCYNKYKEVCIRENEFNTVTRIWTCLPRCHSLTLQPPHSEDSPIRKQEGEQENKNWKKEKKNNTKRYEERRLRKRKEEIERWKETMRSSSVVGLRSDTR